MDAKQKHDWVLAAITFAATLVVTLAVNGFLYAYSQGQMEHRVETLEKQVVKLYADWQLARDRIERALRDATGREPQFTSPIQPR